MRIQGEGHYYVDPNGYQAFRIRVDGKDKTRKAKTLKQLKPKVDALLKSLSGEPSKLIQVDPTVESFLTDWLALARSSIAPNTHRQYEQVIRLYLSPIIGAKKLSKLTFGDCQAAVDSVVANGLSPQTGIHARNVLRRALSDAVKRGQLKTNPSTETKPPRLGLKELRAMSPNEIQEMYTEAFKRVELKTRPGEWVDAHRYGSVLIFLTETGLRISELLGLCDGDFSDGSFRVARQLERMTGEDWALSPLKTPASKRTIPMSRAAKSALQEWRRIQAEDRERVGEHYVDHSFTFTAGNGEPLAPRNIQRALTAVLKAAKIRHYSLHDLRRTFGTTLANKKTPIHVLSALMGHSDIKTTLKYYNATFAEDMAAAVESVSDFVANQEVEQVVNDRSEQEGNVRPILRRGVRQ